MLMMPGLTMLPGSSLLHPCCGPLSAHLTATHGVVFQIITFLLRPLSFVDMREEQTPVLAFMCVNVVCFL